MRSIDRLEQQRRAKQQKKKNLPSPDRETEAELEQPKFIALNKNKSAFDTNGDKTFGGINTAPSIFDSQSVFHTE